MISLKGFIHGNNQAMMLNGKYGASNTLKSCVSSPLVYFSYSTYLVHFEICLSYPVPGNTLNFTQESRKTIYYLVYDKIFPLL